MKKYFYLTVILCLLSPWAKGQVTDYEYAVFMVEAYKSPNGIPPKQGYNMPTNDWAYIDAFDVPSNGYFGVAFKKGNQIVIAHRGTEPSEFIDDLIFADLYELAYNEDIPEQFYSALEFINSIRNSNPGNDIYYTGHSLGAVLAELSAARDYSLSFNTKAVTFESPGSIPLIQDLVSNEIIDLPNGQTISQFISNLNGKVTTYMAIPNLINTLHPHLGDIIRLFPIVSVTNCNNPTPFPPPDPPDNSFIFGYLLYTIRQHSSENIRDEFNKTTSMPRASQQMFSWYGDGADHYSSYDNNTFYWNTAIRDHICIYGFPDDIETSTNFQVGVTIYGSDVPNTLWGATNNNDNINGQGGNDKLYSFEGDDVLNGGEGTDIALYDWKSPKIPVYSNGVTANLATGLCLKRGNGTDVLINIENIYGSDFNDTLIGNNIKNVLKGNKGNDFLFGGGGNDYLEGGDGQDTFYLNSILSGQPIIVDNDGVIKIDGTIVTGDVAGYCSPAKLYIGSETFLLYQLSDRLIIHKEGFSQSSFSILNWKNGKFGLSIEGSVDIEMIGANDRTFCEDNQIAVTLNAVLFGCNDCPFEFTWNINGIIYQGASVTVNDVGTYNVTLTADDGNCPLSTSDVFEIKTECCSDCGDNGEEGGEEGDGNPGNQPCITTSTFICIPIQRAVDPNEIIAPQGYGDERWVSISATLPYKVLFENDPEFATAPAQKVVIRVPLDTHLNMFSLRLGEFGFGDFVFPVPVNATFYQNRLDVRDSLGVFVDVTAGLDVTKKEAFWIFQSVDPATNLPSTLPADVGFLPVNDSITRRGEGYVTFTLQPASDAVTGDTITAQASIIFDINAPLPTNIETNLIDAFAPGSTISDLPETADTNCITLIVNTEDDPGGVGVATYDLYVAQDSGVFVLYQQDIDTSVVEFCGNIGSTYHFYTRASDHVGNEESPKLTGDETITLTNGTTNVSGRIIWEATRLTTMTGVKDVDVTLGGDAGDADTTLSNGNYALGATTGVNFTVTPKKNKPLPFALNGLTTADASRIVQHALNIFPITDPYKLIAADVNKNNSITTADANLIIQAIIGNPFAQLAFINTTWRFVPEAYVFPNPLSPWGFPEQITLVDTSGIIANQNFIGSKLGDVNNSANPDNLIAGQSPNLIWKLKDQMLTQDAFLDVEFKARNFNDLLAYQFSLRFDTVKIQLLSIETAPGGPMEAGNFGTYSAGEIRAGLALAQPASLPDGAIVFRLKFKVMQSGGKLSDFLYLDNAMLQAEAYSGNYTPGPVSLIYDDETNVSAPASETLLLMQNRPNPFSNKTSIGFLLPDACEAQIRVMDVNGVLIEEQKGNFAKGYHELHFHLDGHAGEGVLYYELTTPFGILSKEMLLIRH